MKPIFRAALLALLLPGIAHPQDSTPASREILQTRSGPILVESLAHLTEPWGMTWLPDGRLLITEKPGNLRIYSDRTLSAPIAGVPKVAYQGQGGLLDVEVDPSFASNGWVYLFYVEPAERQAAGQRPPNDPRLGGPPDPADTLLKGGAVLRGRLDGAALRDTQVIWRQVPKTVGRGHFGGRLVFAPDGNLFITSGDRQRFTPAQDRKSNLGKVVRIAPDGSIPKDNPFANGKTGARADIWSIGHRNPLGAAIHPGTRRLWIHEMGPRHGDEINVPEPGKDYGWPAVSNGDHYNGEPIPDHATQPRFAAPLTYWVPSIAPSGFIFYTGSLFPDWKDSALIGGLVTESLIRLTIKDGKVESEERIPMRKRIRDVIQAADGSVLLLTDDKDGELLRLSPATRTEDRGR